MDNNSLSYTRWKGQSHIGFISKSRSIGLSSVQRSVDKYNGELQTDYGSGMFKAVELLYPPENLHGDS